jgi:hypothetical protein
MSVAARKELIAVVRLRYREADRDGKKLILDELTKVTGYHRKHAIRLLTSKEKPMLRERSCRRVYDEAVNESLVVLWEAADRICGKRLKAALPLLLDSMEKYGHLKPDDSVRSQLLAMSAATIDRRLRSIREHAYGGRKKKRAALNRIRKLVPVRTFADWGEPTPGFFEMDMVVHCGERAEGSFVHSLVLTDVASGWTECIALPVREQALIVEAVDGLRSRLPFPVLGIDTDNDSAFLNDTLFNYCNDQGITLTRSRAYHKNDQAWVEQKNGSVVRKLVGYGRLEGLSATAALRRLYESSRLYTNFFQPSFKLSGKTRCGARVHKTYDDPLTPFIRLHENECVSKETKAKLKRQMDGLDPVALLKQIREHQEHLVAISRKRTPESSASEMAPFVKNLAIAWKSGEVRPTHRSEPKRKHWWRARPDPFANVWPILLGWLEEQPDLEAKAMLKRLQASGHGHFPDGQLRTLQRRVRVWRMQVVRHLVYGAEEVADPAAAPLS